VGLGPPPIIVRYPRRTPLWLVFVGIVFGLCCIASFVAVLIPVLQAAPQHALAAGCISSLKQTTMGQLMYAADHDDRLPDAERWMDQTTPYVKIAECFRCPKVAGQNPDEYGYAMDIRMSGKHIANVEVPGTQPLLFESVLTGRNAHSRLTGFPNPPRHEDRNTFSFVDGHVRMFTLKDAYQLQNKPGRRRP
jgi:prepilin-type processing-associated H-X9-DG protein